MGANRLQGADAGKALGDAIASNTVLKELDLSGGSTLNVKPSRVVLSNATDVTAYRQKLAKSLKRSGEISPQQQQWIDAL